ncbi:HU family DNA-binding protein [Parabacteroides sp. AF17-28]|uniref:HU family DNA-binding protein n=2 Tax=Parabacteroides TaxID=375288 RepID=UPI000EFFBEA6|nr:HU family DNA-binding protein [Parabacteroides sp. AF17-28]RHR60428.1 HU family DNA-binding protein [Parabacteroides sp. AF17-28]
MNKKELSQALAHRLGITCKESQQYIDTLCDVFNEELRKGNSICLQNFGQFSCWQQPGRMGRNPRTGVPAPIPPRKSIKFKPGKGLMKILNP